MLCQFSIVTIYVLLAYLESLNRQYYFLCTKMVLINFFTFVCLICFYLLKLVGTSTSMNRNSCSKYPFLVLISGGRGVKDITLALNISKYCYLRAAYEYNKLNSFLFIGRWCTSSKVCSAFIEEIIGFFYWWIIFIVGKVLHLGIKLHSHDILCYMLGTGLIN